jgi:tetratricopeptide (TPR) repeat protein
MAIALAGWFVVLAFLTWQQVQVWRDTATLWEYALDAEPECTVCLYNQGALLYNRGKPALAVQRFEQIMAVRPDRARAQGNLGLAYVALGDLPRAAQEYRSFLSRMPDDIEAHNNLGVIWIALGRPRDAIFEFEYALRLQDNPVFRANLALALLDLPDVDRAVAEAERAVRKRPDLVQGRFALGLAYARRGDRAGALHQYDILTRLDRHVATQLGLALLPTW